MVGDGVKHYLVADSEHLVWLCHHPIYGSLVSGVYMTRYNFRIFGGCIIINCPYSEPVITHDAR